MMWIKETSSHPLLSRDYGDVPFKADDGSSIVREVTYCGCRLLKDTKNSTDDTLPKLTYHQR